MRRPVALALAAAALCLAACSASPCQKLGEKLCACTGLSGDSCTSQVEEQLKRLDPPQSTLDECQVLLDRCNPPTGALFCEWLRTQDGQVACGLAPEPQPVGTTTP